MGTVHSLIGGDVRDKRSQVQVMAHSGGSVHAGACRPFAGCTLQTATIRPGPELAFLVPDPEKRQIRLWFGSRKNRGLREITVETRRMNRFEMPPAGSL